MKRYYECHITILGKPAEVRPLVQACGWKFSAIDGDPDLGDGVKCYATRHFNFRIPEHEVIGMLNYAATYLEEQGMNVLRQKVEVVVYDSLQR